VRHSSAVVIAVSVPLALAAQMPVQSFPTAVGVVKINPIYLSFCPSVSLTPTSRRRRGRSRNAKDRLPFGSRFF
jgi:hypothetical protein